MNAYFKVIVRGFLLGGSLGAFIGFAASLFTWSQLAAAGLVIVPHMFLAFGFVGATIACMFLLDPESEADEQGASTHHGGEPTKTSAESHRPNSNKHPERPAHNHGAAA